jgi:hypothetical protein
VSSGQRLSGLSENPDFAHHLALKLPESQSHLAFIDAAAPILGPRLPPLLGHPPIRDVGGIFAALGRRLKLASRPMTSQPQDVACSFLGGGRPGIIAPRDSHGRFP